MADFSSEALGLIGAALLSFAGDEAHYRLQRRWATGLLGALVRLYRLDVQIDPSIIGGMTIRVGSVQIDSSLATKLNKLSLALKSGVTGAAA